LTEQCIKVSPVRFSKGKMEKRQGRSNTSLSTDPYSSARALRGETVNPGIEMMLYTTHEGQEIWTRVAAPRFRDGNGDVVGAITMIKMELSSGRRCRFTFQDCFGVGQLRSHGCPSLFPEAGNYPTRHHQAFIGYQRSDIKVANASIGVVGVLFYIIPRSATGSRRR
jgi:hypothetical protein